MTNGNFSFCFLPLKTLEKLTEIKNLWNISGRNGTERRKGGNRIMDALIENADRLEFTDSEYQREELGIRIENGLFYKNPQHPPTLPLILEDIYKKPAGNIVDLVDVKTGFRSESQEITGLSLIASMMEQMGSNVEMDSKSALSIVPTRNGLGKTKFTFPPWVKGKTTTDKWRTALCLPGSLTGVHADYWLTGQLIQHIFGTKLWLLWPQTTENIEQNTWPYVRESEDGFCDTIDAIKNTKSLLVYFCTQPATFLLPPHCRHAVFTFEVSAHTGLRLCHGGWKTDLDLISSWILGHMKDEADKTREGESQAIYVDHTKLLVKEVVEDLLLWNEWASKNKSERDILDSLASFTEALNTSCKTL
jgi:hypothetical protein